MGGGTSPDARRRDVRDGLNKCLFEYAAIRLGDVTRGKLPNVTVSSADGSENEHSPQVYQDSVLCQGH